MQNFYASKCKRTWRLCRSALGVSLHGTVSSADLGGSSKYSNENFED
jgi:hypothetical protein